MAKASLKNATPELGDYVEIIKGQLEGWFGILGGVYCPNGVVTYVVLDETNEEVFYEATEIKLYKKA